MKQPVLVVDGNHNYTLLCAVLETVNRVGDALRVHELHIHDMAVDMVEGIREQMSQLLVHMDIAKELELDNVPANFREGLPVRSVYFLESTG